MEAAYLRILGSLASGQGLTLAQVTTRCEMPNEYVAVSLLMHLTKQDLVFETDGKYMLTDEGKRTLTNALPQFEEPEVPMPRPPTSIPPVSKLMKPAWSEREPPAEPRIVVVGDNRGNAYAVYRRPRAAPPQSPNRVSVALGSEVACLPTNITLPPS